MLRIRIFIILLLVSIILLVGCMPESPKTQEKLTGQVVKEIDKKVNETPSVERKEPKPIKEEPKIQVEEKTKEKPEESYDLKQLEKDINEVMGSTYNFTRDKSHPDYVRSSHLKYYVIHTISNKENFVENLMEFCDKYCGANWNGWQYYINMSNYRALFPLLSRNDFANENSYKEYLTDANFINYTFIETSYNLEHGKVLEYQLISWELDNSFTYFEGAHDGTFLIYKIYCAPNMTVLIMPKWDIYKIELPSMTLKDSFKTWNNYIISTRKEFLNKSNELLKRCPVEKEFFEDYKFPEYYKSELLTGYWKVYYTRYFNISGTLEISAKPKGSEKYILRQVNVSFTNFDDIDIWNAESGEGVNLRIDVKVDDERDYNYYDHRVTGILEPGKSISRSFEHKEIEFYNNITVRAALYVEENVELKPIEKTITKNEVNKD